MSIRNVHHFSTETFYLAYLSFSQSGQQESFLSLKGLNCLCVYRQKSTSDGIFLRCGLEDMVYFLQASQKKTCTKLGKRGFGRIAVIYSTCLPETFSLLHFKVCSTAILFQLYMTMLCLCICVSAVFI